MALSSGIKRKASQVQPAPGNLTLYTGAQNGFGNGFRFHYDGNTSQGEWSRTNYNSANDSTFNPFGNENGTGAKPEPHHDSLPNIIDNITHNEAQLGLFDRLAFNIELATRYHARRHAHYEHAFRVIMFGIVLFAAFAFVSSSNTRAILGLSIIGLAMGTFVWNIMPMSRLHESLRSEYRNLLEQMRRLEKPTEKDIRHWRDLHLRIRAKEPPLYWGVADECYDETARAWHLAPKARAKLPWMLRPFINWLRF